MIAVTFALPTESSGFIRLLQNRERPADNIIIGRLHGKPVEVLHTGVGERVARARVDAFLAQRLPRVLVSSGFAGALSDELVVGDLLLAENFSAPDLLAVVRRALAGRALTMGKLHTTSQITASSADRAQLAGETGAAAADMETEFITEACAQKGIPMLSMRVITDTPAATFPVPPQILFDLQRQRTNFGSLAFYLARHPGAIGRLLAFARQVSTARRSLASTLQQVISAL
ncbi:MAG: hypothetical protein ABR589_12320 [Chthoniobacterales bacterium]